MKIHRFLGFFAYISLSLLALTLLGAPSQVVAAAPTLSWTSTVDTGTSTNDATRLIRRMNNGDIIVASQTGTGSAASIRVARLNGTTGTAVWTTNTSPGDTGDDPDDIVIDPATGDAYISCRLNFTGNLLDWYLFKIRGSDGAIQWSYTYNGPFGTANDVIRSICMTSDGHIVAAGMITHAVSGAIGGRVIKLNSASGALMWEYKPNLDWQDFHQVVADSSGNAIATGYVDGASLNTENGYTVKLNATGGVVWTSTFNGTANDFDIALALAVDTSDNVYIAVESRLTATNDDIVVAKLAAATGVQQWRSTVSGAIDGIDVPTVIQLDGSNNVYVAGQVKESASANHAALAKLNPSTGAVAWKSVVDGTDPAGFFENFRCIAFNGSEVYAASTIQNTISSTSQNDIFVGRFDPANGSLLWSINYNSTGTKTDNISNKKGASLIASATDTIYFCGTSQNPAATQTDGVLLRFAPAGPVTTAPTVTTAAQSGVTSTSATLGGNVTADGGATVTERGIVWKTSTGPTTADNKVANGSSTGSFSGTVSSLPAGTTVFVRAYAINSVNTSYGNEISFNTLPAPTTVTSLNRVNSATTNLSTVNWTLSFVAANTGVSASNFSLSGTASSGASVGNPTTANAGLTWNVPVTTGSTSGTLTLNLANATGTTPGVSTSLPFVGESYTMDKTAPTISIGAPSVSTIAAGAGSVTYTVTYTDTNFSASTLANGNITLNATGGASATVGVSGSGNTRTVTLSSITGAGTLGITIGAGTASDTAGNTAPASAASTTFTVTAPSSGVASLGTPAFVTAADTIASYTVPAGTNRLLLVTVSHADTTELTAATAVTFGGQPLTQVAIKKDGAAVDSIWGRVLGTSGSATSGAIVVTRHTSTLSRVISFLSAQAFQNVNQTTPTSGSTFGNNPSMLNANSMLGVSSSAGDLVMDLWDVWKSSALTLSVNGGQTVLNNSGSFAFNTSTIAGYGGFGGYATSTKPGAAGTVNTGWTSNAEAYIHLALNIKQAAGALPTTTVTSLNRVNPATTNLATVNWTLTFAAANTGVSASNFTLSGAAAAGATVGSPSTSNGGLTWNVPVTTGSTDGTLTLNLANATGTTPGVSTSLPFPGQNYTMDKTRPSLVGGIGITDTALKAGDTATVTFNFTEAVSGFTNLDLSVANGTLSAVSTDDGGVTWTATFTPSSAVTDASNTIVLDNTGITDASGNTGVGTTSSSNYTIDTQRPTATLVMSDTALTVGETSELTITFDEPVGGFTNADLSAANGTLTSVTTGDGGITWTATFTPSNSVTSTTNVITLANSGITDAAGNAGTGTTSSNNYAIDTQRPTATIVVADNALSVGETSLVTITFNEPVIGFTNVDLTIPNGTLTAVSTGDGGTTWTATLTPTAGITDPTNVITLTNTGVTDVAGNAGVGSTTSNNYAIATEPTADIPVSLSGGTLTLDASGSGSGANTTFRVVNGPGGPFLEISDPGRTLGVPAGGTAVDANTVRVPLTSVTNLTITGSNSPDTFTFDFADGDPLPTGTIEVNGGLPAFNPPNPGDSIVVTGGSFTDGIYGPGSGGSGQATLDTNVINFTGLEPVDLSGSTFVNFTVDVDPTSTFAGNVITTVSAVDAGVNTNFDYGTSGLESLKLGVVSGSLTLNGDNTDNDYFLLKGLGTAMVGDFSVDGKGGNADVVDISDTTITVAGLNKNFSAKADFVGLGRQSASLLVGNVVCSGDITLESDGDISGTPVLWGAGGVWGTSRPVYFNSAPIATERGSVAVGGAISKTSGADATCTIKAKAAVVLPQYGNIISTSSKLHVVLNADTDATSGGAVSIAQQNIIRSNGGNITVGGGADPATTPAIGSTTGGNLNFGVNISASEVTSDGGNISIRGTGRAVNNGVGVNIAAQQLVAGTVVNSGSGTLTIVGTGGGNFTGASGIRLAGAANASSPLDAAAFYSAKILSSTGTISVNGITAAGNNIGITAGNWTEITASGVANISVSGTGFGTGAGISLSPVANVSTHLGNITSTSSISSAGGNVTVTSDKMALNAGTGTESIATNGTGSVTLKPLTAALAIDLGSTVDTASALELSALELDTVTAPTLVIGDSASGSINVSAVIAPLNFKTLAIANNTTFAATGGFTSTVTSNSVYEKVTVTGTVNIATGAAFTATATGGYIWNGTDTFTLLDNDASDAITGTVAPAAIPSLLGSALTGIIRYNVGTNANDITIGSMSIIEGWRQTYFSSVENAGNSANSTDSDNDGKSNLLEFAFGTIPTNIASGPGDLVYTGTLAGNGTLTATGHNTTVFEPTATNVDFRGLFVRRKDYIAAGLTYTPQFSVDMQSWHNSAAVPTVLADDGTWEIVSVPYIRSIGGRKARFFRMAVSIAP